jgi:hypothetical protein
MNISFSVSVRPPAALACTVQVAGIRNDRQLIAQMYVACGWLTGSLCVFVTKFQCLSLLKMSDVSKVPSVNLRRSVQNAF